MIKDKNPLQERIIVEHPDAQFRKAFPKSPLIWTDNKKDDVYMFVNQQRIQKIPELLTLYDIHPNDPEKWKKLAFRLACDHVEGFKYNYRAGRKPKKSVEELCRFYRYFINVKSKLKKLSQKKVSDRKVCEALETDKSFKHAFPQYKNTTAGTLQDICSEVKKMRRARILYSLQYYGIKRASSNSDDEITAPSIVVGDPPPWIFETQNTRF